MKNYQIWVTIITTFVDYLKTFMPCPSRIIFQIKNEQVAALNIVNIAYFALYVELKVI